MHPASPPNGGYADTAWALDNKKTTIDTYWSMVAALWSLKL